MSDKPSLLSVYIETTIPSYLTSYPSRDLVVAAQQQLTHDWWNTAHDGYRLVVSEAVLDEIAAGDPVFATRRRDLVADLEVLPFSDDVADLIRTYSRKLGLSGTARADVVHFAFAVAYNIDYLVTWNCAHIANGHVIRRLIKVNGALGRATPLIVTPTEMVSGSPGDDE